MIEEKEVSPERVSVKQKCALSLGLVSDHYASQSVMFMAMPIYNVLLGVSPIAIGFILGFFRVWDAFTDPIVGRISDNFRSKFGRRKPLILVGAISTGIAFPLIWLVPEGWSEGAKIAYLSISLGLYYCAYSIYSVSYLSLSLELSSSYSERVRLFAFRNIITTILTIGIPWLLAITYWDIFSSPLVGAKIVGLFVGVIIMLGGVITTLSTTKNSNKLIEKQPKVEIWRSFSQLRSSKIVMPIILLIFFKLFELSLTGALGFYVNSYFVYSGDIKAASIQTGIIATSAIFVSVFASATMYKVASYISKEKIIFYCLIVDVLGAFSKAYTYTPDNPNLMFTSILLLTFSSSVFWIVIMSMLADACDWDECHHGIRREGMISAFSNWLSKSGMALGLMISGGIISISGLNVTSDSLPSEATLFNMRIFFVVIPIAIYLVSLFIIKNYSLSKHTHKALKIQLKANREFV